MGGETGTTSETTAARESGGVADSRAALDVRAARNAILLAAHSSLARVSGAAIAGAKTRLSSLLAKTDSTITLMAQTHVTTGPAVVGIALNIGLAAIVWVVITVGEARVACDAAVATGTGSGSVGRVTDISAGTAVVGIARQVDAPTASTTGLSR